MDADEVREAKAALRRTLRAARRERAAAPGAEELREAASRAIREAGAALVPLARDAGDCVAAFHPTPTEADPRGLVRAMAESGMHVLLPCAPARVEIAAESAGDLDWACWDGRSPVDASASRGFGAEPAGPRLGIEAISRAGVILAPALAVDTEGNRLGHGGGYYDRALARARADVLVVAILHPAEVLPAGSIPTWDSDRPVHAVLTAEGLRTMRPHPVLEDMILGGA